MSQGQRLKDLISKYGKTAIAVHMTLSALSFGSCYMLVRSKADLDYIASTLDRIGLAGVSGILTETREIQEAGPVVPAKDPPVSAGVSALAGGSVVALAYVVHKALLPIRVPATVILTPLVARAVSRARSMADIHLYVSITPNPGVGYRGVDTAKRAACPFP
eukprot:jgi/Mesvir1/17551/Mv08800-RA.1